MSAICNWLKAGVKPHEVRKLAGHSDIAATMAYHAMVDEDALDRARAASERIAGTLNVG